MNNFITCSSSAANISTLVKEFLHLIVFQFAASGEFSPSLALVGVDGPSFSWSNVVEEPLLLYKCTQT